MANEIYNSSWWGLPIQYGWGGIYYDLTSEVNALLSTLQARATYSENITCTTATLTELESILYTPYLLLGDSGFILQEDTGKIIL